MTRPDLAAMFAPPQPDPDLFAAMTLVVKDAIVRTAPDADEVAAEVCMALLRDGWVAL